MVAAQHGSLDLVQRFAHDADLDSLLRKNFDNKSAIDFAREKGHTHIVDYLNNQQNRIRTLFGISKLILAAATGIIIKTVFSGK